MLAGCLDDEAIAIAYYNMAVKKVSLRVSHERLGHQNIARVKNSILSTKNVRVKHAFTASIIFACSRIVRRNRQNVAKLFMQMNWTIDGFRYFLLLKDEYSHLRSVFYLKQKSEVGSKVKRFVMLAERNREFADVLRTWLCGRWKSQLGYRLARWRIKSVLCECDFWIRTIGVCECVSTTCQLNVCVHVTKHTSNWISNW